MPRTPVLAVLAAAALLAVLVVAHAPVRSADPPERVIVTNFPEVQRVSGRVTVPEPVPHSALVRRLGVIVPPIDRAATTQLVEAGILDAAGFTHAVLSLRGEVQGTLVRDGVVGVVLVPDEDPVVRAFHEQGRFDFALEVEAPVLREARGWFASEQPRHALGFPSYRIYLYNSSDRSVDADVFVYLTS